VDGVEHGILHHEVVDRVAGQAELREDGDGDGIVAERARRVDDRLGVSRRVGDRDGDRAGGDPGEPVPVDALEQQVLAHPPSLAGAGAGSEEGG
jgi:hypothetical protein